MSRCCAPLFLIALLTGCFQDIPGIDTLNSLDTLPSDQEPVTPDFCIIFYPPPNSVDQKTVDILCAEYPYSWEEGCEKNDLLQTCQEFIQGLTDACDGEQDSCAYRTCSQALQQAPCGVWPDECQTVAECDTPPPLPPEDPSPTSTGDMPPMGGEDTTVGDTSGGTIDTGLN